MSFLASGRVVGLAALFVVGNVLSCSSSDSPGGASGVCGMCNTMASQCSWSASDLSNCLDQCKQREQRSKPDCKNEYDAALVCFNDATKWSCTSGPTGCGLELSEYDSCTLGYGGCDAPAIAACGVCDTLYTQCKWGSSERCNCRSSCEYELKLEGDCKGPYDALAACFSDPTHWDCTGSGPYASCSQQQADYHFCKNGDLSWKCKAEEAAAGSWTLVDGLPKAVNGFAVDPAQNAVYAACGDFSGSGAGVYRSTDAGQGWSKTTGALPGGPVTAIAFAHGTLFAIADYSLYASADAGGSWSKKGTDMFTPQSEQLLGDPFLPTTLYTLSTDGPKRSDDSGVTWTAKGAGLPLDVTQSPQVQRLAAASDVQGVLYAATGMFGYGGNGIYKTTNRGDAWSAANKGMLDATIRDLIVRDGGVLHALEENGKLFASSDGAASWTQTPIQHPCVSTEYSSTARAVRMDRRSNAGLVVMLGSGAVLSSADTVAWTVVVRSHPEMSDSLGPRVLLALDSDGKVLLTAVTDKGAYRFEAK